MANDITRMRYLAAELRKELEKSAVEGCYCEVEAFEDGTDQPKIKVRSSASNYDQQTLYCLSEVALFCESADLNNFMTVETLLSGTVVPVIIIF